MLGLFKFFPYLCKRNYLSPMMIDVANKLIDNDLSKDDLLKRVEIRKTTEDDFVAICKTLARAFDLSSPMEAMFQLTHSKARLDESVKLVDKENGDIYGILIFCEYPITMGSPILKYEKNFGEWLDNFKQVNGHSFIIDKRLRGSGLDKKMLYFNKEFIRDNYELLWIAVERDLRTHGYWQRLGFVEVFKIEEAVFYMIPLSKKLIT